GRGHPGPEDARPPRRGERAQAAHLHLAGARPGQVMSDPVAQRLDHLRPGPAEELEGHVVGGRRHPARRDAGRRRAEPPDLLLESARGGERDPHADEEAQRLAGVHQLAPPAPASAPATSLSTIESAHQAASVRTWSRAPGQRMCRAVTPPCPASASHTAPTGLSSLPPPGPAMPLTATARSAPDRSRMPAAISRTVSSLTAPALASVSGRTPSWRTFSPSA